MKKLINFWIILFMNIKDWLVDMRPPTIYTGKVREEIPNYPTADQLVLTVDGLGWISETPTFSKNKWVNVRLIRRRLYTKQYELIHVRSFTVYNIKLGKVFPLVNFMYTYIKQPNQEIEYTITRNGKAKLTKAYCKKYDYVHLFQTNSDTRHLMNLILSKYKLIKK